MESIRGNVHGMEDSLERIRPFVLLCILSYLS